MRFRVKVLQKHPYRTSNERDDMIHGNVITIEQVVETTYKLLYGLGVEVRVEEIKEEPEVTETTLEFIANVLENARDYLRDATDLLDKGCGLYDRKGNEALYDKLFTRIHESIWGIINKTPED